MQSILEVFSICSGANTILTMFSDTIFRGPTGFMFKRGSNQEAADSPLPFLTMQLAYLKTIAQSTCDEPVVVATIDAWLASLSDILGHDHPPSSRELSLLIAWPMVTPGPFLDLIAKRHPPALSVLAHYCVLIRRAESKIWCLEGWGSSLMEEISSELRDSPWESTLRWPTDRTNN